MEAQELERLLRSFESHASSFRAHLDRFLAAVLRDESLAGLIHYAFDLVPYRERAFLCDRAGSMVRAGSRVRRAISLSLELFHHSTLVIDDFVDNSPTRGGRSSLWKKTSDSDAFLVGETLHALAFASLGQATDLRLVREATDVFGGMIQAQFVARERQPLTLSLEENLGLIYRKTGRLFEFGAAAPALALGRQPDDVRRLRIIGRAIGMSQQVRDDIADVIGEPALTGKDPLADLRQHEPNLVLRHATLYGSPSARRRLGREWTRGPVELSQDEVISICAEAGSIAYAIDTAAAFTDHALPALAGFRSCKAKRDLQLLVELEAWFPSVVIEDADTET